MEKPGIQLLGTGTAFHTDGRGSQSILIRGDDGPPFLVDLGPTAPAALARFGVATAPLERLFVTHLHGDHTAGWPFLALNLGFLDRRERPFHLVGPDGVRDCLEGLMQLCYQDIVEDGKLGFEMRYQELAVQPATKLESGPVRFDVVPMEHHPTSIGYRFHLGRRTVAVSGDTRWCAGLEELAAGSDLLILECTGIGRQPAPHVSLEELREKGDRLGGCDIVLIHLTDAVATDLAADPLPRVTAGYDGLTLPL